MYTCANCNVYACLEKVKKGTPRNCPMNDETYLAEIFEEYQDPEVHAFYLATKTSGQPGTTFPSVPRLRYAIDFCRKMGYRKIGLAFCVRMWPEAQFYAKLIRRFGIEVVSVSCCNCGINLQDLGVPLPEGVEFDAACNPIGQARLMNEQGTEYNLVMGLCLGHDSLFMRYADAMSTVVVVKDPATAHCPSKALYLYNSYYERFFIPPESKEDE